MKAKAAVQAASLSIEKVEAKPVTRNPQAPFTTSTLQQEASRKLGFSASQTMQTSIASNYGDDYLPGQHRVYKSKAKNAQEAHEAIRPTSFTRTPESLSLQGDQKKLYALIWKRAMSSQMASAKTQSPRRRRKRYNPTARQSGR